MSHLDINIADNTVGLIRAESDYSKQEHRAENKSPPMSTDELNPQPNDSPSENILDNGERRDSCITKRRKQKESRRIAEETIRLHERFDLVAGDELITSCSAALFKKILLQGRLYITTHHIFFHRKLLGIVTKEAFPYMSLAKVEKRRSGFFPNAIKLYFADEDVLPITIGSLNNRDKVFSLIQERLQILNSTTSHQNINAHNRITKFPESSYAAASAHSNDTSSGTVAFESTFVSSSYENISLDPIESSDRQSESDVIKDNATSQNSTSILDDEVEFETEEMVRSLACRTEDDIVGIFLMKSYKKKAERSRAILNAPVKDVFNLLFSSDWINHYHGNIKNYNLDLTEWKRDETGRMCRNVRFRRPLAFKLGPKETQVNEKQWISYNDQGGVIVEVQGRNIDVPYSTYFTVDSFFEMLPINDGRDTLFLASVTASFTKSTFLQGQIENVALSETKTAYGRLVSLAKHRVGEHLLEQAASQISTTHFQTIHQKTENSLEIRESSANVSIDTSDDGADQYDNLNGISANDNTSTVEEIRSPSAYESSNPSNNHVSLQRMGTATSYEISHSVAPVETVPDTSAMMEHTNAVKSYLRTSLFILLIMIVLLAILIMRLDQLVGSLQKMIGILERGVNERQC